MTPSQDSGVVTPAVTQTATNAPTIHVMSKSLQLELKYAQVVRDAFGGELRDVTKDRVWQKKGVDVLQRRPDGTYFRIDDKVDSWASGNMAIEMVTLFSQEGGEFRQGWAMCSEMGWLRYCLAKTGDVFMIPVTELREEMLKHLEQLRFTSAINGKDPQAPSHVTLSALLPLTKMMDICPKAVHFRITQSPDENAEPYQPSMLPDRLKHRSMSAEEAREHMFALDGTEKSLAYSPEQVAELANLLNDAESSLQQAAVNLDEADFLKNRQLCYLALWNLGISHDVSIEKNGATIETFRHTALSNCTKILHNGLQTSLLSQNSEILETLGDISAEDIEAFATYVTAEINASPLLWHIGRYKGQPLAVAPTDYIEWALGPDMKAPMPKDIRTELENEIRRRQTHQQPFVHAKTGTGAPAVLPIMSQKAPVRRPLFGRP